MTKQSRHIPSNISKEVKGKHFFECAWCGEKLTERHHIIEFSQGGKHSSENLILLCPNCHTQVHRNEINTNELLLRKSTHVKGDRISGGLHFEFNNEIRLGNAKFIDVPVLIQYKTEPIIFISKEADNLFLSTRFYNKNNELIFWMSSNRYWTNSIFTVISKKNELIIKNEEDNNTNLRIWQQDNVLNIEGKNYVKSLLLDFSPDYISLGDTKIIGFSATSCGVGIMIE
jgi:hypothetical protein